MKEIASKKLQEFLGNVEDELDEMVLIKLVDGITSTDHEDRLVWASYVLVFIEIKENNLTEYRRFQFYFTDPNVNPREIMVWLLETSRVKTKETQRLLEKLKECI